jgi:hypothetical protein
MYVFLSPNIESLIAVLCSFFLSESSVCNITHYDYGG